MPELEDRIVAHHVGGRGFGVALNCPPNLAKHLVHVVYEADELCAREMIKENKNINFHILPHCLGEHNRPGKILITSDVYASSNLKPNREYDTYYCEVALSGEIDGVPVENTWYDLLYGKERRVVEVRDVEIRRLDSIMKSAEPPYGLVPDFLSLDTQGSELSILKGGEQTVHNHCLALATEIEFHPMYKKQPLFSDIFDFALGHGFHFVGFTYLQEISSHRLPLGARAKGVLAFGDALFFRNIDSVRAIARSPHELYLMLLKLAFIALNFGHLEFALQATDAADEAKPDPDVRHRLLTRDCYRLLYDLRKAVGELPPRFLHVDRREMAAERKAIIDRVQSKPIAVVHPASDSAAPVSPKPLPPEPACSQPGSSAAAFLEPTSSPPASPKTGATGAQREADNQRIRYLLFTNPPAAIAKLVRHFRGPMPQAPVNVNPVASSSGPPTPTLVAEPSRSAMVLVSPAAPGAPPATPAPLAEVSGSATAAIPPPSPHSTPVESVLESYGYFWLADVVRRRRKSTEHCIPARMY